MRSNARFKVLRKNNAGTVWELKAMISQKMFEWRKTLNVIAINELVTFYTPFINESRTIFYFNEQTNTKTEHYRIASISSLGASFNVQYMSAACVIFVFYLNSFRFLVDHFGDIIPSAYLVCVSIANYYYYGYWMVLVRFRHYYNK